MNRNFKEQYNKETRKRPLEAYYRGAIAHTDEYVAWLEESLAIKLDKLDKLYTFVDSIGYTPELVKFEHGEEGERNALLQNVTNTTKP